MKEGEKHWLLERATAVALVPLTLWFLVSMIAYGRSDHAAFVAWLGSPISAVLMAMLLAIVFYHIALGLQVIVEDYIHPPIQAAALLSVRLGCFIFAAAGVLSVLRIMLAS